MEMLVLIALTFMAMFLALGVILFIVLMNFYSVTIPALDEIEWDDVDWENGVDETKNLRPLLGVVHPGNKNLL